MAKWQRAVCVLTILAAGATMVINSVIMIRRGNEMIAIGERLQAVRERRSQIAKIPTVTENSRLESAWAQSDIDREEMQLFAERSYTNEGYAISQSFVITAASMCLFAVGLTLGVTWRGGKAQPPTAPTVAG